MPVVTKDVGIDLGPFPNAGGYTKAERLDAEDPLARHREQFVFTDPELIYLDGNSLGRQPREAKGLIQNVVEREWGDRLIQSWNEGWWELQLELGELLAPIVGAREGELIISDSTSVNLYKLATAAVRSRPDGRRIITDDLNFPTDVYVLDGVARDHDLELQVIDSDGMYGPVAALLGAIDDQTALVSLSHTTFKSGFTYDMAPINDRAHEVGALTLWDTSHSVGSGPIDLEGSRSDLAVGCTYKYLNGGPGSPAFLYVRKTLQTELNNPISAWWAHARPFEFDLDFEPVEGIRRFHTGTMPILSLAAIEPGLSGVLEAGMDEIRKKSVALGGYLIDQWQTHLQPLGFELASPKEPEWRGSHISLSHEDAWRVTRAMIDHAKVIPDFRAPDSIRLGLSPLYTNFVQVHTAVMRIKNLVQAGVHESVESLDRTVT